jgi:hypothetical protein
MSKLTLRAYRKLMLERALEMQRSHPNPASFDALIAWLTTKLEATRKGRRRPRE